MLRIVTWKWKPKPGYRSSFGPETVNTLKRMVGRHYPGAHEVVCITDDAEGIDPDVRTIPLWSDHAEVPSPHGPGNPSCYRRLKAFSNEARALIGERFVSLDLDCVVTGDLRPLWDRPEAFMIWGDTSPRTPYNGSMFLLTAGARSQVWERFDPVRSPLIARQKGYWGSDQAWIGACLGDQERRWTTDDGVYSFRNHLQDPYRPARPLPANAAIVFFHGKWDPWAPEVQAKYPWVREHYR